MRQLLVVLSMFLLVVAALGAQSIVQLTDSVTFLINPATMSGDGSKVFYLRREYNPYNPTQPGVLYLRRMDSSTPEVLAENVHMDWMLSDRAGSVLIFGLNSIDRIDDLDSGKTQVFSLDVPSKRITRLVNFRFQTPASTVQVAMAEKAGKLIIAPFRGGLWEVTLSGGDPRPLVPWNEGVIALTVDAEADRFYLADGSSANQGIWLVRRSGERQRLVEFEGVTSLFAMPDGSRLFFGPQFGAFRYTIATKRLEPLFPDGRSRIGSVSADGKWILAESSSNITGENPDRSAELFLVSADGSTVRQLTQSEASRNLMFWGLFRLSVKLSDDGDSALALVYSELSGSSNPNQILYRIDTLTSQFQLLDFTAEANHDLPQGLAGGPHVIYRSEQNVTPGPQFILARADGSHRRPITDLSPAPTGIWSPNGTAFAYSRVGSDSFIRLLVYRMKNGQTLEIPTKLQMIFSGLPHDYPRSPLDGISVDDDGEFLAFAASRKARAEDPDGLERYLYLAKLVAGGLKELKLLGSGRQPVISYDGSVLTFEANREGRTRVMVIRSDGSGVREIGGGSLPQMSADGRWVTYLDGNFTIVLARSDGSVKKSFVPDLGPNGKLSSVRITGSADIVAAVGGDGTGNLFVASFDQNGKEIVRLRLPEFTDIFGWSLDGAGNMYFVSSGKILDNRDGNREIFIARLKPFNAFVFNSSSTADSFTAVALVNSGSNPAQLSVTARFASGKVFSLPVAESLPSGPLPVGHQVIIGGGGSGNPASIQITSSEKLSSFIVTGSHALDRLSGSAASEITATEWVFPLSKLLDQESTQLTSALTLFNPHEETVRARIRLEHPVFPRTRELILPPLGTSTLDAAQEFLQPAGPFDISSGLLRVSSSVPVQAQLEIVVRSNRHQSSAFVPGLELPLAFEALLFSHVVSGGPFRAQVWIVNPDDEKIEVELEFLNSEGELHKSPTNPLRQTIGPFGILTLPIENWIGDRPFLVGYLRAKIRSGKGRMAGVVVSGQEELSLFSVRPVIPVRQKVMFPYLAQNQYFFTGYTVVNPYDFPVRYAVRVFDRQGIQTGQVETWIGGRAKQSKLLGEILAQDQVSGYFIVEAEWPLALMSLVGDMPGPALANIVPQ